MSGKLFINCFKKNKLSYESTVRNIATKSVGETYAQLALALQLLLITLSFSSLLNKL